jgi:putative addiction module component (TIGR02574 family)
MLVGMPLTADQIIEATQEWPQDVVAELIERIVLSRHGGIAPKVEKAWAGEINRRIEEIRTGKVKGIPGEEVSARIRKLLGR